MADLVVLAMYGTVFNGTTIMRNTGLASQLEVENMTKLSGLCVWVDDEGRTFPPLNIRARSPQPNDGYINDVVDISVVFKRDAAVSDKHDLVVEVVGEIMAIENPHGDKWMDDLVAMIRPECFLWKIEGVLYVRLPRDWSIEENLVDIFSIPQSPHHTSLILVKTITDKNAAQIASEVLDDEDLVVREYDDTVHLSGTPACCRVDVGYRKYHLDSETSVLIHCKALENGRYGISLRKG